MAEISFQSKLHTQKTYFPNLKKHYEMLFALLSGILLLIGWLLEHYLDHSVWYIYLAAYLIGGYAKAKEGWEETIHQKRLNVELLMILAAIGAACIGYWQEGATLIFIFALSGALESYATQRTSNALSELIAYKPATARLVVNGIETVVPVEQLNINDVIRIKPGERVSADGHIIQGETTVDQSTITGESIPVFCQSGAQVMAGTMNIDGSILVQVDKKSHETLFSRILKMVETAQAEKVPSQQFIEKIEPHYVKGVLVFTAFMLILPPFIFGWAWDVTFYRAMILLVVSSPCALVASTMPAVLSAIAFGARQGILVKGGMPLEQFAKIRALAFDKTGTLTVGKPEVTALALRPEINRERFLSHVAAIEHESTHPLATAIVDFAAREYQTAERPTVQSIRTQPGFGVTGRIDNISYTIGKAGWINQEKINAFHQMIATPPFAQESLVYVAVDDEVIGCIALKDQIRTDAQTAITALQKNGMATVMLTGDNKQTAEAIAKKAGVTEALSNCLPENKVQHLKHLQKRYGKVAMIGDGVNDTPALATADLGIAMGGGTDAALETADIVLVKNDLKQLVNILRFSRKMNRIIKQNIIFSLGMIAFLIINTFLGDLSLPLGVIGHEGSTILVILNGLRLLRG
ncbi:ATPase [Pullulanibacillus camelliae]|uniref:ATPase n=2 Tax=Pullulanibacillus camelliae TaxID=1707096 RepID=A0A8J2YID1_9BACL|nr:ATPase [Pullulanibacillus camelliae]